jgi:hypothetical protein
VGLIEECEEQGLGEVRSGSGNGWETWGELQQEQELQQQGLVVVVVGGE